LFARSEEPILCYISGRERERHRAYFTTGPLEEMWGDGWAKKPYECNAGDPYPPHNREYRIFRVAYDGEWQMPCDGHWNSPWSVKEINQKRVPWLQTLYAEERIQIFAGTSLLEFIRLITRGRGHYYFDRETWLWLFNQSYVIPEVVDGQEL